MSLFNKAENEANTIAPEPTLEDIKGYKRKKFPGQREMLLKNPPHEKVICTLNEEERICPQCNDTLIPIGREFIRTEIKFIPTKIRVLDYYCESYECRTCKKTDKPYIEKSPMNYPIVMHSMASLSSVAHVMYQKFVNALPLYRQEKDWDNYGVKLSRATMANWIIVASRVWLSLLVNLMHEKLQQEKYIHADETKIQVLNEPGRKNTTDSFMWVYSTYVDSKTLMRIFDINPQEAAPIHRIS